VLTLGVTTCTLTSLVFLPALLNVVACGPAADDGDAGDEYDETSDEEAAEPPDSLAA